MHVGGFHAVSGLQGLAGASKGLQGRPGAFGGSRTSRGLQNTVLKPAAYRQSLEPWARLKFHAGWSGWTRPPTMAGGGGGGGSARDSLREYDLIRRGCPASGRSDPFKKPPLLPLADTPQPGHPPPPPPPAMVGGLVQPDHPA